MSGPGGADRLAGWRWYGLVGLVVGAVGLVVGVAAPELRCALGLDCEDAGSSGSASETSTPSTTVTSDPSTTGSTAPTDPVTSTTAAPTSTAPPPSTTAPDVYPPASEATWGYCPRSVQIEPDRSYDPPVAADWYDYLMPLGEPVRVRIHHPGDAEREAMIGGDNIPRVPVEILSLQADCRLVTMGVIEPGGEDLRFTVAAGSALFTVPLGTETLTDGRIREAGVIDLSWTVSGDASNPNAEEEALVGS